MFSTGPWWSSGLERQSHGVLGSCSRSRVRSRALPFLFWGDNVRRRTKKIRESIKIANLTRFSDGRRHGNLHHWNGQMDVSPAGTSHTLWSGVEWTDGTSWAGSFPYFGDKAYSKMDRWMSLQQGLPILYFSSLWNGQMEHPGLAASHTSEDKRLPCIFSRGIKKKVAWCPKKN